MKYKPTIKLRIIPALIQSHKHSLMGLYTRGDFYTEPVLRLEFFTPAICISRKRNGNKTKKKQCSCGKIPFYYLTTNKIRSEIYNSEPLAPLAALRLKFTWRGALISLDLLKMTLLHMFLLHFYNGFIFGRTCIWEGLHTG